MSGYTFDFAAVWEYRGLLAFGLLVSVELLALALVCGLFLGLVAGVGRLSHWRLVSLPSGLYIELFRGTPALIQLFWFYYAFPILFHIKMPAFLTGVLSLSLFTGAYVGEIVRGGIQSVHKGQMLAARALGFSLLDAMREVVLPQAVRRMLPPLISQSVDVFKATALASTITVPELMYQTYYATSQTFRFVEFYTISALVYFVISLPLISYVRRLEVHVGV
jgi:polar amino acid transport system permease protein